MTDLRKAAEMALAALNYHFDNEDDYLNWRYPLVLEAKQALRQALAMKKFSKVNQEIEEAIKVGTKAWADVPDATKWVDELRGDEQEPFIVDRGCWEHEAFYRLLRIMGTFDLATGHADSWDELLNSLEEELRDVLGHLRERREWVGLTDEDLFDYPTIQLGVNGCVFDSTTFAKFIESKLKEKNT